MQKTTRHLGAKKNIALVAHDSCKQALIDWCIEHKSTLAAHHLFGTGTTGHLLEKASGLPVNSLLSGPMGGDLQLGSMIATGQIDMLIFFWDPMNAVPHDPDVKALMRISTVWNIPMAMNAASAELLIHSSYFYKDIDIDIPDYDHYLAERLIDD